MEVDSGGAKLEVAPEVRFLLNLLVKQHVRTWYNSLSQDEQLFQEFERISSHIQTTLSARVEAVDWQEYSLVTLPEIILRHLEDFNIASDRTRADLPLEDSFLRLQTHHGLVNQDLYMMHVADALLVVLLPENDLMSDIAYTLSRELISDLVLRSMLDRLSETWFWDEILLKVCRHAHKTLETEKANLFSRIGSFLLSMQQNMIKSISNWRRIRKVQLTSVTVAEQKTSSLTRPIQAIRELQKHVLSRASLYDTAAPAILRQLLVPSAWPLSTAISLDILLPLVDIFQGEELMRRAAKVIHERLSRTSMARMVRLTRQILVPDDEPSQARIIPTTEQQIFLRLELSQALPAGAEIPFFQSKTITKVLLFRILDSLLGTIFPELRKRTPEQLKEKVAHIREANVEAEGSGGIRTGFPQSRSST